ncbi:hypothetical protein [Arthrobacter sp. UYCo732]|uniref:hypothetical protein n=1 Tax=Arthrobacter sp. UYCo732 TaxID=3156336 RepID=UPI003394164A
MTTPRIDDIISSLITPEISEEIRGQLPEVDGLSHGLAKAEDFHSLRSWPVGGARYYLVHNDDSAVLFLNETLVGVAEFDRKLLSKKHPEKRFTRALAPALAEGGL